MRVGKTNNDGRVSIFTKDDVTVHKEEVVGSTKVWVFEQALEIGFLCRKTGPFSAEPVI